ncbi:MAG: MFS transporter [Pseudomonadota bacterium]|nr:MFS transporter [Pseudomonadota bacterium]
MNSIRTHLAYGLPALPLAAVLLPFFIFMPNLVAGRIVVVGTAWLVLPLFCVVLSLIVLLATGMGSDSLRTGFGRRKPWFLVGAPLLTLGVWEMFTLTAEIGWLGFVLRCLILVVGWMMTMVPLIAHGAELTLNYRERTLLAGVRGAFALLGLLAALTLIWIYGQTEAGLVACAWLVMLSMPVAMLVYLVLTPTEIGLSYRLRPEQSFLHVLSGHVAALRLLVAVTVNSIAIGIVFALFVWPVQTVPTAMTLGLALFTLPIWLRLSMRFSRHRVWACAIGVCALGLALLLIVHLSMGQPPGTALLGALGALIGIGIGPDLVMPSTLMADCIDRDTWRSGRQRTGLWFVMYATFVGGGFMVAFLVDAFATGGFGSYAIVEPVILVALGLKLIAMVLMWKHPLGFVEQEETRRDIEARWLAMRAAHR